MSPSVRWWVMGMVAMWCLPPGAGYGQALDTLKPYTLPPTTVSVTRADLPLSKTALAVQTVDRQQISQARPTWGLDEALFSVPGVYAANRYNFSLDQRISIRGFGSRSAFAVRGIKVLLDGIPQTLPDGQGQLTNLELGSAERIEVLRGSASALFGNAAGGVISIWTRGTPPGGAGLSQEVRVVGGAFDRRLDRTWTKWQSTTRARVGDRGSALLTVARLSYAGERDHSAADLRSVNGRFQTPVRPGWTLTVNAGLGDQPRADNPGALTLAELRANRDSAPAINLSTRAGKDVLQAQGGLTLRGQFNAGGEAALTLFGLSRDLENPTTFAYIRLDRRAYGARASLTHPLALGRLPHRLTVGLDFQRQKDDRLNLGNNAGAPDTSVRTLDQLEHVTEIGPFLQSVLEVTPRVTVTTGVRYDRVAFDVHDRLVSGTNPDDSGDRVMHAVSGSFGIALNPSEQVTVYTNVGSSFETPTTTELANRPNGAGGFNDSLGPQRAWSYEVGMRGALDGRLKWSVALYQADVRDELISYEVPGVPQRRFFRNAGTARHRGIEFGADARLAPGVSVMAAWTYSDFRYRQYRFVTSATTFVLDGRALPGIPNHSLHLNLRARPAAARGGWIEVETMHSSSYLVDDTLATRTTPWWRTSVRLGWEGTAGTVRMSPFVGFNNLFNRHYVGSVVINAARGRYYEPAPGRNLYVGFSLGAER
ncbi:MAG: TonB-dependent receptor family protein [Gemmatimonadales bacterium]